MNKEVKAKIVLLTGGHAATPALATVEEIKKRNLDWQLFWVGPTSAMETQQTATAAEKTLSGYGVTIKKINAGKLLRKGNLPTRLKAYFKIPLGFVPAFSTVASINPDVIVSFGGFAALPVVFSGWLLGKKIIIQEQITGAGLANKLSAPFAKKIAVARTESLEFFPKSKTVLIGNPQVAKFFQVEKKEKMGNPPVVFITGGSSGSQIINTIVASSLKDLLPNYNILHQTGENNLSDMQKVKESLPSSLASKYEIFGYVNPNLMASFFEKADIVVSRSGANTVADIVISKKPAILIPIPWSIGDEQRKNALKAKATGLVTIIEQDDLTAARLLEEIANLKDNWQKIIQSVASSDYDLDKDAAAKLVDLVEEMGE